MSCHFRMFTLHLILMIIFISATIIFAQTRELVWADEFNGTSIDPVIWEYDIGPSNDNIHYYTSRSDNVKIIDNVLNISALEESYMGFDYTSALIKTKVNWRYGRVEARIKLPATKGFVPAFWMLPADNMYTWWPNSGEIDIMEHPTNEVSNIYGSIHTQTYNNFGGIGNVGDVINVADAESAFHVYAIEWDENKIDFYVDDNLYYTFTNDNSGSATWPFDQSFYIILNLAVGGGWVGDPDETTVFPAVMQVDWVRVYQYIEDISIAGQDFVPYNSTNIPYSVPALDGAVYSWQLPGNAEIISGQNTNEIALDWNYFGGSLKANIEKDRQTYMFEHPVNVSDNVLKNGGFEKGVKYWIGRVGYPAKANFSLNNNDYLWGAQSLTIDVQTVAANPWDIQISQTEIILKSGQQYKLSFWARSDNANAEINLALINYDFFVYYGERFELSTEWTKYEINYTATVNDEVSLNIDMGTQTGVYYFDQFMLSTPKLMAENQVANGDFFDNKTHWNFLLLGGAQAQDTVINGEYLVSITNGGVEAWDIHLGQPDIHVENGKEYVVTFDAYASSARTISTLVGKNSDPWTVYHGSQVFSISTEKQTYEYTFIMNSATDTQARFGFDIGGSTTDVFVDNVRVTSGTTPVSAIEDRSLNPKTIRLFQNFPNPFNPTTTIRFYLAQSSYVELSVYNLLGQKIKTLLADWRSAGAHNIEFAADDLVSGVYLYRLQVNRNVIQTRKLVLLK